MNKYTPGPWTVEVEEGRDTVFGIEAGSEKIVETDCGFYPPKMADARLIAAAPDLYEAAKMLEDLLVHHSDNFRMEAKDLAINLAASVMIEKFREGIAKAEGKA